MEKKGADWHINVEITNLSPWADWAFLAVAAGGILAPEVLPCWSFFFQLQKKPREYLKNNKGRWKKARDQQRGFAKVREGRGVVELLEIKCTHTEVTFLFFSRSFLCLISERVKSWSVSNPVSTARLLPGEDHLVVDRNLHLSAPLPWLFSSLGAPFSAHDHHRS